MSEVRLKQGTYSQYMSCTKLPNCLYFLDTGQVYKGDKLLTNIFLVDDLPSKEEGYKDSLYIDKNGKCAFFDGEDFYYVSRNFATEIIDGTSLFDNDGVTVGALKKYVRQKEQVRSFPTLYDFPLIGKDGCLYLDLSEKKLYIYSSLEGRYIPIRIDGSAIDVDLIDVNFN